MDSLRLRKKFILVQFFPQFVAQEYAKRYQLEFLLAAETILKVPIWMSAWIPPDIGTAVELYSQLSQILESAGICARKWCMAKRAWSVTMYCVWRPYHSTWPLPWWTASCQNLGNPVAPHGMCIYMYVLIQPAGWEVWPNKTQLPKKDRHTVWPSLPVITVHCMS